MRRLSVLVAVALLAIGPIVAGVASAAQGGEEVNEPWVGVGPIEPPSQELVPPPPTGDTVLQPFSVPFDREYAVVPEITRFVPEFMVVFVRGEGFFALDVGDVEEGIVVFPAGGEPIPFMTEWSSVKPHYEVVTPAAFVQNASGGNCLSACPLPANRVVRLKPGDKIVAREGALCFWCLLNSNGIEGDETGLLEVYPLLRTDAASGVNAFSWIQDQSATLGAAAASPSPSAGRARVGWGLFNPPTNCR